MNRGPDVELVGVRAEWVTTEGVVRLHVNVEGVDFVPVRNGSRGDPDVAARRKLNAGVARDLRAALDVKVSGAFAGTFWADIALERVAEAVKKIPEAIAAFNRRFPELLAAHQEQAA